jgi:PleD family two-component response regulator
MNQAMQETAATVLIAAADSNESQPLADILAADGFQICAAGSGPAWVELAREAKPDLILAGFDLPQADDLKLCQAFKASSETRNIPIIAVTAATDPEFVVQLFEAGAIDLLFKPIRPAELVCRVKRVLAQRAKELHRPPDDSLASIVTSARKICHEMNQPLQYVLGSVQLLMMDIAADDPLQGSLGNIRMQVERMGQLNAKLMETIRSIGVV